MVDEARRKVLKIGLGAAVASVPLLHGSAALARGAAPPARVPVAPDLAASPPRALGAEIEDGPVGLFAPLAVGDLIGSGWAFAGISAPDRGAMLLQLRHEDGAVARVHVCANSGCAAGVASTDRLDFLLMNGGRGVGASDEALGVSIMRLAELAGPNGAAIPAGLLTHEDRIAAYGDREPGALQ